MPLLYILQESPGRLCELLNPVMAPDAQLFAMAYGTVPIAHATGGLRDTIAQFQPDKAGVLHIAVLVLARISALLSRAQTKQAPAPLSSKSTDGMVL